MPLPKVSVIIPVHNAELYLEECLDSVINQTLKDIEIICVDDGSTDTSGEILKRYAAADDRVTIIVQENRYAGTARNVGMKIARGEYWSFLDADDFFDPTMLEKAYRQARRDDADIIIYGARYYDVNLQKFSPAPGIMNTVYLPNKRPFSYADMPKHIFDFVTPAPWNKLFNASFIRRHEISFQDLPRTNDLYFTYTAIAFASKITAIDEALAFYRTGGAGSLQSNNDKSPLSFYEALMALRQRLSQAAILPEVEKSFVNLALSSCIYNLNSLRTTASFTILYNTLRAEGFRALGIQGKPVNHFYNPLDYRLYAELMATSLEETYLSVWEGQDYKLNKYLDGMRAHDPGARLRARRYHSLISKFFSSIKGDGLSITWKKVKRKLFHRK